MQRYAHNMPSETRLQRNWAHRFGGLNLSGDQQQRIQSMIHQYSLDHPQGTPRDRASMRALRHQIMGTLSSDQQYQFRQQLRARRAQMRQGGQAPGGYEQGAPDQRYQQEAPGQYGPQYQQGPQGPQYQQGPQGPPYQQGPDQQYGPQYQQGPPGPQYGPQYQQEPPPQEQPPQ
jgi:hypothetical protein